MKIKKETWKGIYNNFNTGWIDSNKYVLSCDKKHISFLAFYLKEQKQKALDSNLWLLLKNGEEIDIEV